MCAGLGRLRGIHCARAPAVGRGRADVGTGRPDRACADWAECRGAGAAVAMGGYGDRVRTSLTAET
eukprot:5623343-Prymnesium_polylepis.2